MQILLSLLVSLFILCHVQCRAQSSEETALRTIRSHIIINDGATASRVAWQALQENPGSKALWISYIKALSKAGDEPTLIETFRHFVKAFPEEKTNKEVLEEVSWGIIEKSYHSSSPIVRLMSILGAFFSQDARGIILLRKALHDENSLIRGAVLKLSSHLKDSSMQDEVMRLLLTEPVWKVRVEAIRAAGAMQMADAKPRLLELIADDNIHHTEKVAAMEAVIVMADDVEIGQLKKLVASDRAGLRVLACELVAHYDQKENAKELLPLTKDYHAGVRAAALQTLGLLRVSEVQGVPIVTIAEEACRDPDAQVSMSGAWLLALNDKIKGQSYLQAFLTNPDRDTRHLASGTVAALGKYGQPLMEQEFARTNDPYVKMNLAIGMVGQHSHRHEACHCLFSALSKQKEHWEWKEEGVFRYIAPSQLKHDEEIPNYPEAINQLTRLEVLEILAMLKYPQAQDAIKAFLKEHHWGITGMASALLLTEGDETAVDLVRGLLSDPDKEVRLQAALILAMWGREEEVVKQLQDAYPNVDRDLKGQILEGIGRVGSQASLPFLADRLQDPFPTLRIISAAATLECLYH